ncbi:cilia- and flagella-associated protein 52 isoform X2 [Centruroides vittatus]|uniref:cilia- and flagella-associated protein 52 isoform X2 n=1 Tax=Centruroides vittatus TaxID=120091 RepID=UPI00350FD319
MALSNKNDDIDESLPNVELISTIGFKGNVKHGLIVHPDKIHLLYGLGNTIVIKDILHKKECFLNGHSNSITCLAVSKNGNYIASGQETLMNYKTCVILWDFHDRKEIDRYTIHRVKVISVSFSPNDRYLFSLGGEDDGNIVCYNIEDRRLLCGLPATTGKEGRANILKCESVRMGYIKREIICLEIDANDEYLYCGTFTGDIIKIRLNIKGDYEEISMCPIMVYQMERKINKKIKGDSKYYQMGIHSIVWLKTNELLIGTGDGTLVRVYQETINEPLNIKQGANKVEGKMGSLTKKKMCLAEIKKEKIIGTITSISLRGEGNQIFIGTAACHIYRANIIDFQCDLLFTCHDSKINDLAFPYNSSDVFGTCSKETIRIWNIKTSQELLRITVKNMVCNAMCFSPNGQCIISGWDDGNIRAHTPETGKLLFIIHNSHSKAITAVAMTYDSNFIISGGGEGEVRLWKILPNKQSLVTSMKEHRGPVSCIRVHKNEKECVTASTDGTCAIWDLQDYRRNQIILSHSICHEVCYGAKECQIVTCGTNRKIEFWEVYDGSKIRTLDASNLGSINSLDVTGDDKHFVSGGEDKLLKVWKYQEGMISHVGCGHCSTITKVRVSPDGNYIVSTSVDGAILIWKFPESKI